MRNLRHTPHFNFIVTFVGLVISTFLSFFFFTSSVSAISLAYNKFGVWYSNTFDYNVPDPSGRCSNYVYREDLGFDNQFMACAMNRVLVETTEVQRTDDYFVISGKFNIVANAQTENGFTAGFVNKNYFNFIGGTFNGTGFTVDNTSLQTYITSWKKDNRDVQTFTVSFTINGHGLATGTGKFRLVFGNPDFAFYQSQYINSHSFAYFEMADRNINVSFAPNSSGTYDQEIVNQNNVIINQNNEEINAIYENTRAQYENTQELYRQGDELERQTQAINNQTQQQHDDYENEVQREEDKQDELEDQSADLSLSAQSTGNPFASFFTTNSCITLTSISSWFNVSPAIQICSPYPQNIRPILTFVTSAVVVGLLIRLYYKNLKGGFNS